MPIIKLPSSITNKEALLIVQSQGFNTIVSINRTKDGSILIEAK